MANEIDVSVSLSMNKGGINSNRAEGFKVTMSGDAIFHGVQSIPTSNTGLEYVDLNAMGDDVGAAGHTAGWIFLKNLDSTNFVSFGITGQMSFRLLAGESCVVRQIASAPLFALADTAACNIEMLVIET